MKRPPPHLLALSSLLLLLSLVSAPETANAAPAESKPDCFAKGAYTHNGFFLYGGTGIGALFVDSDAAISNGFQQRLPSSANGLLFPTLDLSIGGTLKDPLLVLGARYSQADAQEPVIHTADESFTVPSFRLGFQEFSVFGRYYLDPHVGTHVGGSIGFFSLYAGEVQDSLSDDFYPGSEEQNGVGLSIEGGQDFWLMNEVSFGLSVRLAFARLSNDSNVTLVFAPTLLAGLLYH